MRTIQTTAFDLASRFSGLNEVSGTASHPQILAMLQLDQAWPEDDQVPWCSAFTNYVAWLLRLPRSKNLRARSWLAVGRPVPLSAAEAAFDIVVLSRGTGKQPGPEVLDAPGHVGFFAGRETSRILLLGGNQANSVTVSSYPSDQLLGVRRLLV